VRLPLSLALVALAACSSTQTGNGEPDLSDVLGDWSATLQPQASSSVRGTARAQAAVAATGVTINISGATPNSHLPWHVHTGTCATGGPVYGAANAYPMLHVSSSGTATATASIGQPLNEEQRYHVNVHRSETEMNVIISCGDLRN
jgi:hypothetical protein